MAAAVPTELELEPALAPAPTLALTPEAEATFQKLFDKGIDISMGGTYKDGKYLPCIPRGMTPTRMVVSAAVHTYNNCHACVIPDLSGLLPPDAPAEVGEALREVHRLTQELHAAAKQLGSFME